VIRRAMDFGLPQMATLVSLVMLITQLLSSQIMAILYHTKFSRKNAAVQFCVNLAVFAHI
jgi:hypothetical protein